MPCNVSISIPGPFAGGPKVSELLQLDVNVMPGPPSAYTFAWSKDSGAGDGSFEPIATIRNPKFNGSTYGDLTIKVVATEGTNSCDDTAELTVIEINDLTDSVPLQEMDEYDIQNHFHIIPYADASGGNLQRVLISPIDDPDNPYQWIDPVSLVGDFGAKVDATTGNVTVELRRTGVYLVKTVRESDTKVFELSFNGTDAGEGEKLKKAKTSKAPKPSADLILIGSVEDDNFLTNARNSIGSGNYVAIDNVAGEFGVVEAINIYYENNGQQPFTLVVLEHGKSGYQSMGDAKDAITGKYIAYNNASSAGDMTAFTAACNGKVTSCHLGGCYVGSAPNGSAFLQKLADDGNMTVTAWDGVKSTNGAIWYIYNGTTLITKTPAP